MQVLFARRVAAGATCVALSGLVLLSACTQHSIVAADVADAHGVNIVSSARDFQQVRSPGSVDYGVLSMFVIDQSELDEFVAQLDVDAETLPAKGGPGNPCVNGWNVWPTTSPTFVPGNKELDRLKRSWDGDAVPVKMLSCSSPTGDWLHVEVWLVNGSSLLKMYTDWN